MICFCLEVFSSLNTKLANCFVVYAIGEYEGRVFTVIVSHYLTDAFNLKMPRKRAKGELATGRPPPPPTQRLLRHRLLNCCYLAR